MPLRTAWVTKEDFQKQTNNNETPTSLERDWFHGLIDDGISSYQEK